MTGEITNKDWLNAGTSIASSLFSKGGSGSGGGGGGGVTASSASGNQQLDSSDWTVGLGNAKVNGSSSINWYLWAGVALVVIILIKKIHKK